MLNCNLTVMQKILKEKLQSNEMEKIASELRSRNASMSGYLSKIQKWKRKIYYHLF